MSERPVRHAPLDVGGRRRPATPFRPGERPLFIGGRVAERTAIVSWFERVTADGITTALLLYGPRGTGKTTLAGFLAEQAMELGWLPIGVRGDTGSPFAGQLSQLASAGEPATTLKLGIDIGVVSAGVERALRGAPVDVTFPDAIARLAEETTNGVVLVVDEAQAADQTELAGVASVLEDVADLRRLPVAVAVLGTEKLVEAIGPRGGSLGRLHRSEHVELPIRQHFDETLDICAGTLVDHPGISGEAVEVVHAGSGGFPHAVQLFGEAAFVRAGGGVIESAHVVSAHDEVFDRLSRQVFAMMWRRQGSRGPVPQRTREYLGHVADGASSHARIAEAMGMAPTSLAQLRQDLIARGVLVSIDGALDFGIPMMREFVIDQFA